MQVLLFHHGTWDCWTQKITGVPEVNKFSLICCRHFVLPVRTLSPFVSSLPTMIKREENLILENLLNSRRIQFPVLTFAIQAPASCTPTWPKKEQEGVLSHVLHEKQEGEGTFEL